MSRKKKVIIAKEGNFICAQCRKELPNSSIGFIHNANKYCKECDALATSYLTGEKGGR